MKKIEFTGKVDFVADVDGEKDCLLSQEAGPEAGGALWFNIDVPKGHGIRPGDRVRVTVEKL